MKENKQVNIQQKQNYSDSVAFYDTRPGNKVGLFYNGPSTTRPTVHCLKQKNNYRWMINLQENTVTHLTTFDVMKQWRRNYLLDHVM